MACEQWNSPPSAQRQGEASGHAVQRYPKQLLCWLLIPLTVAVDAYYLSVDVRQV